MNGRINYSLRPSVTLKIQKKKNPGIDFIRKAYRRLFGNMVLVAKGRNLDMRDVLKHPLCSLSQVLFNCDGPLKKTNKSTPSRHNERRVASAEYIPLPSACIIDCMNLVN